MEHKKCLKPPTSYLIPNFSCIIASLSCMLAGSLPQTISFSLALDYTYPLANNIAIENGYL